MDCRERFSLLLLDPSEIYFEDYSADFILEEENSKYCINGNLAVIGSIKICSKSIIFEPKNIKIPLIKVRYSDCYEISTSVAASARDELFANNENDVLAIRCSHCVEMLKDNVISPYETIQRKQNFKFKFHYADIHDILPFCQQLHRAASLNALQQNDMIATIAFSIHNRIKFNPLWLENIFERKLYECKVDEIRPLVCNPGRLLLTNSFIYFQPFNNILPYQVLNIKLSFIIGFTKKRFLLRQTGLEIKWDDNKTLYVSFKNSLERKEFCELIEKQSEFNLPQVKQECMTLKWQNRLISNYDYLLYLNSLADRSFEDLTQYPVFPWILNDYVSTSIDLNDEKIYRDLRKPIGALNPDRLNKLKERACEMDEPKYLYGSHYSNPGFVLYYLVRKLPHLMLCLQNGKFDCPDRMFNKVQDTFNNCLNNMSDFKELIPEFYDPNNEGLFLQNIKKIYFGYRSDGSIVNDVILPPWADNSPQKFINILREALESEYVSDNLHHWIDLIFGYKQRGKEAFLADNMFHPHSYEGSVDLDSIKDKFERQALEVQIYEFGQVPKQLFNKPHISRNKLGDCEPLSPVMCRNMNGFIKKFEFELKESYSAHKDEITAICVDNDKIWSTGKDGVLKCYSILEKRQSRSISISNLSLSSCIKLPNKNVITVGSWDNSIYFYDSTFGRVKDEIIAHLDSVSCLSFVNEMDLLISGSWDCSVKIWEPTYESLVGSYSFDDHVVCLTHRKTDESIQIVIGTEIGEIFIWNLYLADIETHYLTTEPKLYLKHPSEIKCLKYNTALTKLASCSINGLLIVNDYATEMELFKIELKKSPNSLCWYDNTDILMVVDNLGSLMVWDLVTGELKCNLKISNGPLSCINYSKYNDLVITSGKDSNEHRIKYWSFN